MDVVAKYDCTPDPEAGADKELLSEKFSRMLLYLIEKLRHTTTDNSFSHFLAYCTSLTDF